MSDKTDCPGNWDFWNDDWMFFEDDSDDDDSYDNYLDNPDSVFGMEDETD